jgi:hydrogenase-4 component B
LLFFAAGSVIHSTGTRELDRLGGLARRMRWTTLAFLVGAVAICGLPPLNGFISEMYLYVGMLKGGLGVVGWHGALLTFGVPLLAMVGALAVACFVKVLGIAFLGEPRSEPCARAQECPVSMRLPMAVLALGCVVIGAFPSVTVRVLDAASGSWAAELVVPRLESEIPFGKLTFANALLIGLLVCGWLLVTRKDKRRVQATTVTWDCGYAAPTARMQYTASSFGEWLVALFSVFLQPQTKSEELTQPFPPTTHFETHVPEVVLDLAVLPGLRSLARAAQWFRWIQEGRIHLRIVYILVALVVMLIVWT